MALKTHHVALKVTDFERSIKFYSEGLGMKLLKVWDGGSAMFDIGDGTHLEMFSGGEVGELCENRAGSFVHFAFAVENPDEWYERAIAAGAKPKSAPTDFYGETSADPLDLRIAFVYGPDGEVLEFFHDKAAK